MKKLSADSFFARQLAALTRLVCRHPRYFFYPHVVLFIASVTFTVRYLEFSTTRSDLVGADKLYHQNYLQFKREFQAQEDLVVVVESEDHEKNRQFVERLGAKLEAETNLFKDVFYARELKMLGSKALLFLPEADLLALRERLDEYRPFIEQFTRANNLDSFFNIVNTQFRTAKADQTTQGDSLINALPALERIVVQATASLNRGGTPPSPGVMALFGAGPEAEARTYITFAGGRIYIVTARPPDESLKNRAVERLRKLTAETREEVPGVNAGITGEPVLEHDEMRQSQKDTALASVVALLLCALIFIYGYQETGRPVKTTICLLVGVAYTMAFTTATVGHLNILTITFVPILIGLAIDFGVHLVTRYEEELRHGRTEVEALSKAMVFTGRGIFTGAFTTAGAFLAMGLTDFKGIQEMGVICGAGLLICLIPMITLLPVLLLRGRQNVIDHDLGERLDRRSQIENLWLGRPKTVAAATTLLCLACLTQLPRLFFDYNLLNMQSQGLPAVEFEEKLFSTPAGDGETNAPGRSILFAAVVADSVQQARDLEAKIRQLPSVAEVDSIASFLSSDPARKLKLIEEIKEELEGLRFEEPDPETVDVQGLGRTLYSLQGYTGLAAEKTAAEHPEIASKLLSLRHAIELFRKAMSQGDDYELELHATKLASYQRALFDDLRSTFDALRQQDNREGLRVSDLPQALQNRFVGKSGKLVLQVYPKKNVWQRDNQEEFIQELRKTLDPAGSNHPVITGTPVQLYEYTGLLKQSYEEAALYALGAIAILVLFHFRSIGSVVLALVPVVVGTLWLGGIMGYLGIPINPANIMTMPLVIGIGVTNGIHILNRFAEEQTPGILGKSTGKAVLVSGLTTIAGFGSLVLAKHRGIESLGYVMATGVATCMIAGITFLPALLMLFRKWGWVGEKNQPSADNAQSTLGREEPR